MTENKAETAENLAEKFIELERELVARLAYVTKDLGNLKNKSGNQKVTHVYNPLEYAEELHNQFVRRFCNSPKKILFLGMNPGPWGMCQTGVSCALTVFFSRTNVYVYI